MPVPSPFSTGFPLKEDPFRSRVESQINNNKNYYGLAFKAGYPLQASELNELQEIFYVQSTLNNLLPTQTGWTAGTVPWNGSTPFTPGLITSAGTNSITATADAGWYLVEKTDVNGGLGVWVYNPTAKTIISGFTGAPGTTGDYGIVVTPIIIYCTTNSPAGVTQDRTLQDSHNMNIINGPCGADRLKLDIIKFGLTAATGSYLAPIFAATKSGNTASITFKNNLLIRGVPV